VVKGVFLREVLPANKVYVQRADQRCVDGHLAPPRSRELPNYS
jgi:hypothetical protein